MTRRIHVVTYHAELSEQTRNDANAHAHWHHDIVH